MADQVGKSRHLVELRKWKSGGGFDGAASAKTIGNSTLVKKIRAGVQYMKNEESTTNTGTVSAAEVRFETRKPYYPLTPEMFIYLDGKVLEIFEIIPHPTLKNWIIIRARRVFNYV